MRRKKALFLSFLLCNLVAFGEKTIQLPESNIQSDYIEINKMKNTKHIIVIKKLECLTLQFSYCFPYSSNFL